MKYLIAALLALFPAVAWADLEDLVEDECEVYWFHDDFEGELMCGSSDLDEVEDDCFAERSRNEDDQGWISCYGSVDLSWCDVYGTEEYGEVQC